MSARQYLSRIWELALPHAKTMLAVLWRWLKGWPDFLLLECAKGYPYFRAGFWFVLGGICALSLVILCCHASHAAEVKIPRAALQYRSELIRASRMVWGLDAPVAVFAAQIHTESWWKNGTVSSAGAQGLAQFMPSTAKWLQRAAPETGSPAPFDPRWSLRACVTYDKYLFDRIAPRRGKSLTEWNRMAFTLSGYNGGLGWTNRDRTKALQSGLDPDIWFGHVEQANAGRRISAKRENQRYVQLIMRERQQVYIKSGWGSGVTNE
ncbi:transglycosylase SLT domain-containing protein [uncultured Bilophila sp.]|uniref:transglycosylase SLT domain-containing protein n=1 Tax=uncultured Bilophila sp. TaxID=529385 RepID=UPI00262406A2|nr:transglycosylase SLT domain-containing protein [uncultured Bilophila sp.]